MHFEDLSLIQYHNGPHDADEWNAPLLAVGWLEHGHVFALGTPPPGLIGQLLGMIEKARVEHSQYNFRGLHNCSLCEQRVDMPALEDSHINLFIPGDGAIYDVTAGAVHYVECHGYLPPTAFIDAVNSCPEYGSAAYYGALRAANGGQPIPLQTKEETEQEYRAFLEKFRATRSS